MFHERQIAIPKPAYNLDSYEESRQPRWRSITETNAVSLHRATITEAKPTKLKRNKAKAKA